VQRLAQERRADRPIDAERRAALRSPATFQPAHVADGARDRGLQAIRLGEIARQPLAAAMSRWRGRRAVRSRALARALNCCSSWLRGQASRRYRCRREWIGVRYFRR
jgi:hypothetical protein